MTQKETLTRERLLKDYPKLAAAIRKEGYESGLVVGQVAGAKAERDRIKAIDAIAVPGHEDLIARLKYDGKTTAEQAALQIVAAQKNQLDAVMAKIKNLTPAS